MCCIDLADDKEQCRAFEITVMKCRVLHTSGKLPGHPRDWRFLKGSASWSYSVTFFAGVLNKTESALHNKLEQFNPEGRYLCEMDIEHSLLNLYRCLAKEK
jgi:hypothetical protein